MERVPRPHEPSAFGDRGAATVSARRTFLALARSRAARGVRREPIGAPATRRLAQLLRAHRLLVPRRGPGLVAAPGDRSVPLRAAALRAGVPNIAVTFNFDQPFWGERVRTLGCGPTPIRHRDLSVGPACGRARGDEGYRDAPPRAYTGGSAFVPRMGRWRRRASSSAHSPGPCDAGHRPEANPPSSQAILKPAWNVSRRFRGR